jgi:predicted transglutaminase-like cysteine proteinase
MTCQNRLNRSDPRRKAWQRSLATIVMLGGFLAAVPAGAYPPLFGARETRSENLRPFQKWLSALDRHLTEHGMLNGPCTPNGLERCQLHVWRSFLESLQPLDRRAQIDAINTFVNNHPYVADLVNWGTEDYWETPREFLDRNGDCEDYAIAKFLSLRYLGFSNDALRIVVLQDLNLRIHHAILAVYLDGEILALDNQIKAAISTERIRHYKPIYSINEQSWWLHRQ